MFCLEYNAYPNNEISTIIWRDMPPEWMKTPVGTEIKIIGTVLDCNKLKHYTEIIGSETLPSAEEEKKVLTESEIQELAENIFSLDFLKSLARDYANSIGASYSGQIENLEQNLVKLFNAGRDFDKNVLPVDRRGLLSFFLASMNLRERIETLNRCVRNLESLFRQRTPPKPTLDPLRALQNWFDIQRFVTLNFDFELEHNLILDDVRASKGRSHGFIDEQRSGEPHKGVLEKTRNQGEFPRRAEDKNSWSRRFSDGMEASTDIYSDRSVSQLFDFALGSLDYRAQIVHLHGRADVPDTMVLTEADSNRQYRRDRLARSALEQALDVVLLGNPILFVGIGLSEPEITRALHELVSRGQATAFNPAFVISASKGAETAAWRDQLSRFRQHAIHVILAGHPRLHGEVSYENCVEIIDRLKKRAKVIGGLNEIERTHELPRSKSRIATGDPKLKRDVDAFVQRKKEFRSRWAQAELETAYEWNILTALATDLNAEQPLNTAKALSVIDFLSHLEGRLHTEVLIDCLKDLQLGQLAYSRSHEVRVPYYELALKPHPIRGKDLFHDSDTDRLASNLRALRDGVIWEGKIRDRHFGGGTVPIDNVPSHIKRVAVIIANSTKEIVLSCAPLGIGKGAMARQLKTYVDSHKQGEIVVINCNFGIEFGTAVGHLLRFVMAHSKVSPAHRICFAQSTAEFLRALESKNAWPRARKPLQLDQINPLIDQITRIREVVWERHASNHGTSVVVFLGIERMISSRGEILSYEFDLLLRIFLDQNIINSGFRCVFIGTKEAGDKIQGYIADADARADDKEKKLQKQHTEIVRWEPDETRRAGFLGLLLDRAVVACENAAQQTLKSRLDEIERTQSVEAVVQNSPRSKALEGVLRLVLERWHELEHSPSDRDLAELDKAVLNAFAFVGMPIEATFLMHIGEIRGSVKQIFERYKKVEPGPVELFEMFMSRTLKASLARLKDYHLIVDFLPLENSGRKPLETRYALHRGVIAEIRERLGVGGGTELISNSFNLTVAISMPSDLPIADGDIQRRLKSMVGQLRSAYKDIDLSCGTYLNISADLHGIAHAYRNAINRKMASSGKQKSMSPFDSREAAVHESIGRLSRALRLCAAPMESTLRAAAGIVRSFFSAATLVTQDPHQLSGHARNMDDGALGEFEEHKRRLDDLLTRVREAQWANVVALRELDLLTELTKDCAMAADLVKKVGNVAKCKFFPDPFRIPRPLHSGELMWLLNERGVIALLQGDLYEAQRSFNEAEQTHKLLRGFGQSYRRLEINRTLLRIERGQINEAYLGLQAVKDKMREHELQSDAENEHVKPVIQGYEALCEDLRGNYANALRLYASTSRLLRDTDRQRLRAANHIRHAQLLMSLDDSHAGLQVAKLGLATAEAGRQLDLAWRAHIVLANYKSTTSEGREAEKIYADALEYARAMNLPRVKVLALRGKAEHFLRLGHIDASSAATAEAMIEATRYGMTLHRVALRVLMGRILLARGDRSGIYLLNRAIVLSNRIGYQRQLDNAQKAKTEARV
jgi:SIR2-like domain